MAGLIGAGLLARGRPQGLALMEATPEGAWRSFVAAFLCLPAFLGLRMLGWDAAEAEAGWLRPLIAEVTGYAIAWVLFALASLPLAQVWGRGAQWPRFICAWNWTNVVQYAALLAATLPAALGLPLWLAQAATLLGLGYAIWMEWFVVRHALALSPGRAVLLVAMDLALGLFLGGLIQRLSVG